MDEKMISLSDACGGYLFFSSPSEEITKYAKLMAKACGKGLLNHRTGGYISGYSGASGNYSEGKCFRILQNSYKESSL